MYKSLSFVFFLISLVLAETNVDPTVTTEYGEIEGINYKTPSGFETQMFLGIPFAKPPIDDLRFEKPLPPIPWTEPLQAKTLGARCATYPDTMAPDGKEDCLTLNIIKPAEPSHDSSGYTVMVWIHGGAFVVGSAVDYNHTETAERMVSQGIIFVSINYRLGPVGFFSTGTSEAPGNYGLWDQLQALKFIQKVIPSFGGNPKSVTIFGESAGGASVSWLTLNPAAKNFFARAIPMSGSALAPWAYTEEVVATSAKLIEATGCQGSSNVKKCLKSKSTEEIKEATSKFAPTVLKADGVNLANFHPRIDGEFLQGLTVEEAIQKAAKKDHFMGICSQEHIIFAIKGGFTDPNGKLMPITPEKAANFTREDFVEIVYKILGTKEVYGTNADAAAEDILKYYESQKSAYSRNLYLHLYAQLFSDISFNIPTLREAQLKAAAGQKVYFYVYSFVPESAKHDLFDGAGHASELSNFFGSMKLNFFYEFPLEKDAAKVQKTMVDLFVNFARTGIPSSENLEVPSLNTPNKTPYVEIDANTKINNNLWADRIEFWENHSKKFGFDWPQNRKIQIRDEL
uniref:Carboxylic ester hydrolase n=1 Tax=Panagrolaimus sp. ES5 TaxID=591445 RepID=A0AC34FAY6_9BILA